MRIVMQGGGLELASKLLQTQEIWKKNYVEFPTRLVFNMLVGFCDMILQQEDTISSEGKGKNKVEPNH